LEERVTPDERIKKAEEEISRWQRQEKTFQDKIDHTERKIQELQKNIFVSNECRAAREADLAELKSLYESSRDGARSEIALQEREKNAALEEKKQNATPPNADGGPSQGPHPDIPAAGIAGASAVNAQGVGGAPGGPLESSPHHPMGSVGKGVVLATLAAFVSQKLEDVGPGAAGELKLKYEQAGRKLKELVQEAIDAFSQKFAPPDIELHGLAQEKAAAEKLTKSEEFGEKPIEQKAAEVKGFFAEQDKLRDAAWEDKYRKTETRLAAAHKNDPSPRGYVHDRNQLEDDIQASRQAERQEVQQWRSEFVQGICAIEAGKQVEKENQKVREDWEQRQNELNTASRTDGKDELEELQEAKRSGKIADRTAEFQEKHFPEIKAPSVESRSISSPAVESPSLSSAGGSSGPGAGR
jgi:hypothetical protein